MVVTVNTSETSLPSSGISRSGLFGINDSELLEAARIVAKECDSIKVTIKYASLMGVITGVSFVIGGVALTPFGLPLLGAFFGSTIGSLTSGLMFRNKFISLIEIIDNLPDGERTKLLNHLREGFRNFNYIGAGRLVLALTNRGEAGAFELLKLGLTEFMTEFSKQENGQTLLSELTNKSSRK